MCRIEKQGEGRCAGSRIKGKENVYYRETRGREMCRIEKQGEGRCVGPRHYPFCVNYVPSIILLCSSVSALGSNEKSYSMTRLAYLAEFGKGNTR
jgi:hypothetical protein